MNVVYRFFILISLLLISIPPSVASLADSLGGHQRKEIGGNDVNSNFCALDSNNECQWTSYTKALVTISLPFLILAILSLLSLVVFFIGRFCFNVFGGKNRNPKTAFLGKKSEDVRKEYDLHVYENNYNVDDRKITSDMAGYYPRWQILFVKLALLFLFVALIACFIVGLVGNNKVHNGIDSSIDQISGTATSFADKLEDLVARVNVIPISTPIRNVTNELSSLATQTRQVGEDTNSAKSSYEPVRFGLTIFFLLLPILVLTLGVIGGLFNLPKLTMVAVALSFIVSFILWMMFAAYIAVSIISNDACTTARPFVTNLRTLPSDQVPNQPIPQFVACSNGATFESYRNYANQSQNALQSGVCSLQNEICSAQGQTCSKNCVNGDYDSTLNQIVNDNSGSLTVESCAVNCVNSNLKTATSSLVNLVTYSMEFDSIYQDDLLPIINCTLIDSSIDQVLSFVCGPAATGSDMVSIIFLVMALLYVFVTIVLILSFKRWRKGSLRKAFYVGPPSPSQRRN